MATSPNDPRITAAINTAMSWMRSQVGKANARSVWAIAYPAWKNTNYHWCGGFPVAGFKKAGVDLMKCAWWFYTPYIRNFAVKIGAWKTGGGNYGDQPLYDWNLDGVIDHVGNSWPDPSSSAYRNVEGNTSPGTAGSQSAGGGCWIRYRTKPTLRGWVDMRKVLAWMIDNGKWNGKTTAITGSQVTATAKAKTKTDGQDMLDVDGSEGPATISRLQQVMGTPIDGYLSKPSTAVKQLQRFLNSVISEKDMRNLTTKPKLVVDGYRGPSTTKAFQYWSANRFPGHLKNIKGWTLTSSNFNVWVDGSWGPATVRMEQAALNDSYRGSGKLGAK